MIRMELNAFYLNFASGTVEPARLTVKNGIFDKIEPISSDDVEIEGIVLPGFIDSHIHIESSLLTPAQFAHIAVRWGVTSVVCDPHEIANVMGMDGIDFMVENSKKVPFNFYFTAPSCVPATSFESSGASITSNDIEKLLARDEFVALAEMMNVPGVLNNDKEVMKKLDIAKKYNKKIDGHAPLLSNHDLEKYVSYGISSDHESSSFEEALLKKSLGMAVFVRDGSTARNLEDILNIKKINNYWKDQRDLYKKISNEEYEKLKNNPIFDCICSDDKHPDDLSKGYLRDSVFRAVSKGLDNMDVIKMVTCNPAKHYNLNNGEIKEGYDADFCIVDNLADFNVIKTYVKGLLVFDDDKVLFDVPEVEVSNSMNLDYKNSDDFDITYSGDKAEVNVIKLNDGMLHTEEFTHILKTENNILQPDIEEDILKISVVQRYGSNTVANAFVHGFELAKGAIASSIAHDSHNIVVVGTNSRDMARAVNILRDNRGGMAIVDGNFEDVLPLPIAGLMTNESAEVVDFKMEEISNHVKNLGCKLASPFMAMSFLALLVIPSIKLSDKGLFDGDLFEFIDVIVK